MPSTQFTCFIGTRVQIMTQKARHARGARGGGGGGGRGGAGAGAGAQFTCFTGTEVQILTPEEQQDEIEQHVENVLNVVRSNRM